jgi:DNA-binding SARP family transcriptional activator
VQLLDEAAALYRDDFTAGFTLRDSLSFDEWQFFQTRGYEDQLAGALERLVAWYAEREEYERALAHARRRLEHDALNENQFGKDISGGFVRAAEKWGRRKEDLDSGNLAFPLKQRPAGSIALGGSSGGGNLVIGMVQH